MMIIRDCAVHCRHHARSSNQLVGTEQTESRLAAISEYNFGEE